MVPSEKGPPESAQSSSSESSDSESEEESCSESNDSESSASSDASDIEKETKPPQQKWRLSTFFDETRRNHSPAFVNVDNNTNSSTTGAAKEEPQLSSSLDKDGFSLADEDSVNRILGKYSDHHTNQGYLSSPLEDYVTYENASHHGMKALSSPVVISSPVPVPPRGPRTPPSPPESKDLSSSKRSSSSEIEVKPEPKHSPFRAEFKSRSDSSGKSGGDHSSSMQRTKGKRNVPKATVFPAVDSRKGSASSGGANNPPSASREVSDDVKDALRSTASCPVPSSANNAATHRSTVRSHHHHHRRKHSSSTSPLPSKADSSQTESSVTECKGDIAPAPPPPPIFKSKGYFKHSGDPNIDFSSHSRDSSRASSTARSESVARVDAQSKPDKKFQKVDSKKKKSGGSSGRHARDDSSNSNNKDRSSAKNSSSKHAPKTPSGKSSKSEKHQSRSSSSSKPESKKPEKKKSKFCIKNFWKSPQAEGDESENFSRKDDSSPEEIGDEDSPPRVSPLREEQHPRRVTDKKRRKSSTSSQTSRSRSRSSSRSRTVDKPKIVSGGGSANSKRPGSCSNDSKRKKHRDKESTPRSVAQESCAPPRSVKSTPELPDSMLEMPPGQTTSPMHTPSNIESAIPPPPPLVVSIPLSKLLRIPGRHEIKPSKDRTEECLAVKPVPSPFGDFADSSDRRNSASSSPCKKDYKAKHRTNMSKTSSPNKSSSEKLAAKTAKVEPSVHRNSSPVTVSDRNSIESSEKSKVCKADTDLQLMKNKRKIDEQEAAVKKKPKVSVKPFQALESECLQKTPVVKIERMETHSQPEKHHLERCDSASSLSSLSSQQSHRSSKGVKERTKERDSSETKKLNVSLPLLKETKREKEEKPKVVIKKEPCVAVKPEKSKSKSKDRISSKGSSGSDTRKDILNTSSQMSYWDDPMKIDDVKPELASHQRVVPMDYGSSHDTGSDYERFTPDIQQELKGMANHLNKVNLQSSNGPVPMDYYYTEGKKLKHSAEKETDPVKQALKYFEATVMFILTSHHRELSNKDPESIYQMYKDTLRFTHVIRSCIQKHQSHGISGNVDFKILILCLKCQSLLHLKLYNLKIKEVKEQHKGVTDFMHTSSSKMSSHSSPQPAGGSCQSRNLFQPSPCQPRVGAGPGSVPSPHSPTPSPAGSVASVGSQSSGYSSSELNGNHSRPQHSSLQPPHIPQPSSVAVPQHVFDIMARHHTHLSNLHMCHELWEQADMYMTRSNSRDFFREVSEKSERLSLHSNIKELVNYLQTGLALLKDKDC